MSRSRRKTKIFGITTADSEQRDKQRSSRALRRKVRSKLQVGDFDATLPVVHEVVNPYMSKDGKQYWGDAKDEDLRK